MTEIKVRDPWYEAVAIPSAELCRHQHKTYEEAENCDRWGRPAALLVVKVGPVGCGYRWGSVKGTQDHEGDQHECWRSPHDDGDHECTDHPCRARKPAGRKG